MTIGIYQRTEAIMLIREIAGLAIVAALALGLTESRAGAPRTTPEASKANADKVVEYDRSKPTPRRSYNIAYLTECVDNPYCVARLDGIRDAAKKYGASVKVFDSKWSLVVQERTAQIAVSEHVYDGYIFGPLAPEPSCKLWNSSLVPTGKPIVTVTVPMCGDTDYTPGLAATFTQQGEVHYQQLVDYAFASCTKECKVLAIGGFVGSQLQNYWEAAVQKGAAKYPNAKVVVAETANFDPRTAYKKTQDALVAHPDITVVVSNWDDMSRGIEQAIVSSGKKPGADIRIYSAGANMGSVKKLTEGTMNASLALLPYDEGYYSTVALIMAMEGKPINGYVDESWLPQVMDSTKTPLITPQNVDQWKPRLADSPFKY
jgi:ABC-type sugar transport system substrate-binding protein